MAEYMFSGRLQKSRTAVDKDISHSSSSLSDLTQTTTTCSTNIDKFGFIQETGCRISSADNDSDVSRAKQLSREKKWLAMTSSDDVWNCWLSKRFSQLRSRCRKGIPASVRGRAWYYLTGAKFLAASYPSDHFSRLIKSAPHNLDESVRDEISRDLHRQFPQHAWLSSAEGRQQLSFVLSAYAVFRPEQGYSQAQAPLACLLLAHMPAAHAFWCLVCVCDVYLPGYFSRHQCMSAVLHDGAILHKLVRGCAPHVHSRLRHVQPVMYAVEWFMCVYCRTLQWAALTRVWDMFLCEGVRVLFSVAVVLLRHALGSRRRILEAHEASLGSQNSGGGVGSARYSWSSLRNIESFDMAAQLRHLYLENIDVALFVREVVEFRVSKSDIQSYHRRLCRKDRSKSADNLQQRNLPLFSRESLYSTRDSKNSGNLSSRTRQNLVSDL